MFTMTTEYALCAACCMAKQPERLLTASEISDKGGVPLRYAAKVLRQLTDAGITRSRRGPTGGFTLINNATDVTLLEVVQAIEPVAARREAGETTRPELCPLYGLLDDIAVDLKRRLGRTSLADLIDRDPRRSGKPAESTGPRLSLGPQAG